MMRVEAKTPLSQLRWQTIPLSSLEHDMLSERVYGEGRKRARRVTMNAVIGTKSEDAFRALG